MLDETRQSTEYAKDDKAKGCGAREGTKGRDSILCLIPWLRNLSHVPELSGLYHYLDLG